MDHLQDVPNPYLQIKAVNKETVVAAGSTLKLDGSYTTKVAVAFTYTLFYHYRLMHLISWQWVKSFPGLASSLSFFLSQSYLEIILESLPAVERSSRGIHSQQAARLQELVEYILSQVSSFI